MVATVYAVEERSACVLLVIEMPNIKIDLKVMRAMVCVKRFIGI